VNQSPEKDKAHKMIFTDTPQCLQCSGQTRRFGKDKLGNQRFHCNACPKTFITEKKEIRLDRKTIKLCIKLLVEGNSIRSTERIAEVRILTHREHENY
jgi:transposase-like protein